MTRYWFKIKRDKKLPPGIMIGCGITAFNLQDAKEMLSKKVFNNEPFEIEDIKEDIDISTLDQDHVIPNMHHPLKRGVWFPLGFE